MRLPRLTRRTFLKTAAAGTAAAAAVGVLSGCTHGDDEETSDPVVVDEDSAENILDTFESVDLALVEEAAWSFPLGNVLHPAEGTWIPVTTAGSSATPMVKASALSLASGQLVEVVSDPIGQAATTVIYDVRCSDYVFAWVELDLQSRAWSLYGASFAGGALDGDPVTLWEGDADFDPAPFAVSGRSVIWQVQPSTSGSRTTEHSFCYLWHLGDSEAKAVVESPGRFATALSVSGDAVVLTPRVRADEGVFYGVTAYSLSDDLETRLDQLVMPQNVRPFRATRVGERFLVSVEASYSTGGLLGQMGTYVGTADGGFFRLNREPSEVGCGSGDTVIIKSLASYFVINLANRQYAVLGSADRSVDYGDYPARVGECDLFVTYATVKDADTGYPATVSVRTFRL
ncbi:MAG TPA: twin-arginine translocation signal domain-containing protein [Candidatus Olsenella excrementavium]|uniref:Twin-arginine translocation signal domain-containing protein n=1 Tax=Candidatus Olsenella excrementavium TaxID=2838709 RepID=A0A9D2CFN8_9ACTN|nr:twin-arginine translocation signal domain-containing protein [Candidatus Olsenella excrementavium]